jgi:hypothetical protein
MRQLESWAQCEACTNNSDDRQPLGSPTFLLPNPNLPTPNPGKL